MKKDGTDTHHIVPVSIGGSDEEKNKIRVNRIKHGLYHKLFNNWHPSFIIRFFFEEILPFYFHKTISDSKLYQSFLNNFDQQMTLLKDNGLKNIQEEKEQIKQIKINFNNKKRAEKFKITLKEFTGAWGKDWNASFLYQRLMNWFLNDFNKKNLNLVQDVELLKRELGE